MPSVDQYYQILKKTNVSLSCCFELIEILQQNQNVVDIAGNFFSLQVICSIYQWFSCRYMYLVLCVIHFTCIYLIEIWNKVKTAGLTLKHTTCNNEKNNTFVWC